MPRVLGILMIVFGSLGALGMVFNLATSSRFHDNGYLAPDVVEHLVTYTKISSFVNLAIAGLDVFGGIALVRYKRNAVNLAQLYALANIVVTIASLVLQFTLLAPLGAMLGAGLIVGSVITVAWSVVVLALSNRPAVKAACTSV